jgi:D-alanyl-D-alanine carboxypeptidase
VQLQNTDAAALFALVPPDLSVLVYAPHEAPKEAAYVINGPDLGTGSYLVADVLSGQPIMQQGDPTERRAIASLTKLMTAVVAAEQLDLESEVLVTQEQYVQTLVPRLPGHSRTTLYNLLQLLMIESSNEAAEVIATQMGRERFIEAMNQKADALGLSATVFTDPSGLDNGNQSSLRDLATLATYIYEQHRFIFTLSIEEEVVRAQRPDDFVDLENFNIVPDLTDLRGGKIGETTAAGQTSLTVHEVTVGDVVRPIVIVLLGSDSRDADVTAIHRYFTERF